MKDKLKKIIFVVVLMAVTVLYTYYFRSLVDDELYNYGFGYNIANGLVPYKDFNMIITPLFSYILALIFKIFGSHLLVYHVVIALMISLIILINYSYIGKKALLFYCLLLIYPYVGYNIFSLLLLFMLFYIDDKCRDKRGLIEPIIISIMFLTKQTLGLLVIPSLIYSKNRKKTLVIYIIFIFMFLIYLIANNSVIEFFDYCLFGMFDFLNKNSTSINILTVLELIIIGGLVYCVYVTKRKDIFLCLMFQIMALPIVNYIHFIISVIPVLYLIFKEDKYKYVTFLCFVVIVSFVGSFNLPMLLKTGGYQYNEYYPVNNFMSGRVVSNNMDNTIFNVDNILDKYARYKIYIFGRFSYTFKLNLDIPITKYDIINDGNMGYNGENKYIEEIDNYCNKNKCLFIINDDEEDISATIQTNLKILNYVKTNYNMGYKSNVFSVYIN